MVILFDTYWPVMLAALLIGLLVGYLVFRPRQRVKLSDSTPVRPHMAVSAGEGGAMAADRPTASGDGVGQVMDAPAHLSRAAGPADRLEKLKGVGPKFASLLNANGLTRFDQIAELSASEVDRLDAHLGPFRGRLERDRIVEQAGYLARGDIDGFERKFGKL